MNYKNIDAAFLQNLQVFASRNTEFRLFLNDINLVCPTAIDVGNIFAKLLNAILVPQLTLHVADIFKNNILHILSGLVHTKNIRKIYENHAIICLMLSKLVNIYPDIHSLAIDYFEKWPAPFVSLHLDAPPACKKSKVVKQEILISDIEIAKIAYIFLKSSPSYFRNKWPWNEFLSKCISSTDNMIQWICCQCIGILTAMNPYAFFMFTTKLLPQDKIDECSVNFEMNFNIEAVQDISSVDIPIYFNANELSELISIASIGGISVPLYKTNTEHRIKLVEVESTINNLRKIAMGILSTKAINLLGPVGSGKSVLVEYIAEKTGRVLGEDFIKVQLGDQTDSKMLLGTYRCTDIPGEFVWQPGVLTQAVINGSWLLLEDIDLATNDIASVLCSLLENKQLSVPGYRDSVPITPGFQLFVTQRLISSITGYHKRRNHASDFLTKHMLCIGIDPLSYNELKEVITALFPKLQTISDRIVSVFEVFTRTTGENNVYKAGRLVSTRDLFKWCSRAVVNYDVSSTTSALKILRDAIDIFCYSHSDKNDRVNLAKEISSHLGIVSENAIYFCTTYKPHFSITPDVLKADRAVVRREKDVYEPPTKFCFTRPSACLLESIMCCIDAQEPVLLVGETGTGKTSTIQFLARSVGQKLIVINMNQQSDSADLLGGFKPVDLKFIVGPIRMEFENIFCSYFNVEQNKTFLGHIAYCFNSHMYNELVLLMKKSYEAAMRRLTNQDIRSDIAGRKRKSGHNPNSESFQLEFLEKWRNFGKKLEKLEQQLKHRNALAFTFIEGSLVKAVEKGYWVLLDEINLANAETLECLSSLLEGPHGSLSLLERGDKKPIRRHTGFTLFACMNPSTDIGKKDLPSGLRNRFTEFFVDELTEKTDLLMLANSYLEAKSLKEDKIECLVKFYLNVRKEAQFNLTDGLGHKPHFSLRSFCRALHIASKNPCGHIIRSLYEAFCLSFLTQLDSNSYNTVEKMIVSHIVGSSQELNSTMKHSIPKPYGSNSNYIQFEGYWIPSGSIELTVPEDYILTKSVRKNLKDLVRIVSIGQLPVLLQGDTSVGKTSLITYLAKASGHKCVRINNHEHTDLQEYVGSYAADLSGKLVFREGLLVEAMKKGYWIILDELNLAPSDVLEALNRVLDDNRELFIPETQETVKAHPNFMLFATQNPPGSYGGRKMLSRAFRNRFIELHFNEIPADELEIILHQRCQMAPSYAKKMINVMKELQMRRRGSAAFAGKHGFITLRDLFRWGERYRLAEHKTTLYDWDQHIADEGYLLLAGKVRKAEEKVEISMVIQKFMKREVSPDLLFTLSDRTSNVTRPILEKIERNKERYPNIVWTFNMRQLAVLLSKALQFHEPALLVGETGCGKTTICDLLAQNNGQRMVTVNCHMHTESSDFIGGLRPVREHTGKDANKLFEWVDGPLIKAMVDGSVFLIDEISLADDSVLERLNSLLEPERTLLLAEKGIDINNMQNSELIVAHNDFHFIGTMNPGGDFGKKELSPALRNRFTEIWCEPCNNKDDLIDIINHNIQSSLKRGHVEIGVLMMDFIEWFKNREIGKRFTISIRDILTWVNFINTCSKFVELGELYINGACITFLDSFGSGVTSMESENALKAFKEECFKFLTEQLKTHNLDVTVTLEDNIAVEKKEKLFGVNPFYIEIGCGICEDTSFTFDVPMIKHNTLKLLRGLQLKKAILLEGSPGVGKTSLVTALAKCTNNKIYRVNLSDQTDISDLFGSELPVEDGESGQFAWRDGPLLQALKKGYWILLDELNLASQSVLEGLNACLDHRGEIFIPELGKIFYVKPGTKFFACQNPLKQGGSRRGLPKSFLNRFTQVYISALSDEDYLYILRKQFPQIPSEILGKMVDFNEKLTKELKNNTFGNKGGPWEYNLRDLTRWCEVTLYHHENSNDRNYSPENVVKLIYCNRLRTINDQKRVKQLFEDVFGRRIGGESTTVYVTKDDVYLGDVCLKRETSDCNLNIHKEDETCLILRSQLKDLRCLTYCVNMNWMTIIVGNSGCGKTSIVRTLAHLAGKTLHTLPVTSAMDTSDLLGGFEQTDYTRHMDDIIKNTEVILLQAAQNLFLNGYYDQAITLLKQWQDCFEFLRIVNKNQTMKEETTLFVKKLENLSSIWRTLCDNVTISEDIKQTALKLGEEGRVLLAAVRKEGTLNAGGKFEWVDSVLIKCLQSGHWLVIDNVNLCSPAVLDRLNALLEPNGTLAISERGIGEDGKMIEIKPHKNFRLFLTMDPKNGEISRAMRNRGVELYLTNDYQNEINHDVKSLINIKGIQDNNIINLLLHMHNFIAELIIADKPNIESILHSAFLISQQLKRGIELEKAVTSTIVDIYYKSRSDYDFSTNDAMGAIKNEIQRRLNEEINRMPPCIVDIFDSLITLKSSELNLNTDLTKIKQQAIALRRYFKESPERYLIIYYFMMHLYSISNLEDVNLRHLYLNKMIANDECQIYQHINNIFYNAFLKMKQDTETIHLPIDQKWLPDTIHKNISARSNRLLLTMYYSLHRHYSNTFLQNSNRKENYDLIKYSLDVKLGKIQDRIDDVVVKEASALVESCDAFFDFIFKEKEIVISDKEIIEIMSLLHWHIAFVNQLLIHHVGKKEIANIKNIVSNLHVYYKWFIKNCLNKVASLFNINKNQDIFKIVSRINSDLVNCFDRLRKLGRRFQKQSSKPPPLTNNTQLAIIPDYHKMAEIFNLGKSANIGKILMKLSDENFVSLLINLKTKLNYDMQTVPENYHELTEVVEKFIHDVDNDHFEKSDVDYLLITDYFSLIAMYQQRNTMGNIPTAISVPCALQGVMQQYQATQDKRLMNEIISQTTQYLLNSPCTMPYKYLKYKSNDENIKEAILSWQNPILTYLLTSILVSPNSKALSLKVDLKTYHYAIKLYNKFNHLLWKNSYQLSNIKYDFMNLESEYIKNKLNTFFQSLGVSLNINVNNKDTIEIIKLCIEEIDLIETMAEDEKKVWRSLLTECHKQLLSLSNTSVITNMNAIASCHITASYLNALLNSKLPSIDPYTKVLLRRNYIAHEIENFETLNYSFQMQSSIYSNVEYPLCPLIKQHIQGLYQKTLELSKEVAVRPHSPEYCSLIMDINHAFRTVLSPAKIGTLYFKLEETFLQLEKGRADDFTTSCSDILQQARLCITSIENFINILNQYRYTYPDIIEPLYSNIMELLYGIKMKVNTHQKILWQEKITNLYKINIQTKFANLAKFPVLDEDQCNMLDVINSYMDVPVQDMISSVSSLEKDSYFGQQTKLNLLKCSIQEIFNSCTTNARYSQIPVVDHYSEFNRLIKRFITTWNEQEKEIERKQNEKDSLYMTRTKCNDKSEEEQIEEEFENLFPTYFIEFSDMEAQELEDNPYAISPNEKESVITSDDINLIYNLHAAFLYSHSKSPWINLNEKHNYLDHIYPIMQKYKLLKLLLDDHRMLTALNYDVDKNILGSLHVLVNVAQSYGCIKVLDEVSSPSRALTKKSADFYRDPNINEVEPCYQILQQLRTQIQHLLLEWPEHPTLGSIITVIERICNFDIASPISRFLTGFDILLNKCHEWEENAHSGVSIQSHIVNVTAQIIVWRKLELNMWRDILNITFRRLNEPIGKWWCHIYQVVEQFQENIITTADLTSTLTKFITESNLAEFENRLELLFLFHCHCIHVKNSDKTNILINVLWNIYHYYKQSLAVVITKIKEFRSPIEKKLKDYIKIITWKDINYWSIKDTLRKTHKAIHKHVREYEKVLRQPVYPFLNEIDQQGTEYQGIGIWDRPQRTSPKSYHYTMDCLPYITRKGLSKKLSETTDIKMDKYFKKSLVLCKEIITLAPYPKYVKSLDLMVGEIIETSSHLQKLEVDTTLPKDKQKTLAKNILQQKHRSLADLFKLFTKIGVSFKKGILESKLNESAETKFTLEPINLEILFDHLNRQRNDEKILTMWDGCELYYLRSSLRLNMLEDALQQPSKDLGLPNVQRCKGFANDLMALINTQKQKLIRTSETFYYLRYYSNYFRDLCNETNFIHKDTFEDLRSTLSNLIIVMEQYKILFETCPEEPSDATILKTIPILKPVKDDVLCYKYDTIWNKSTGMLNGVIMTAEKILVTLRKNKNIIPSRKRKFSIPTYIPFSDFNGILEDLESIQMKLNNLLTLLGNIPLYNSLKWALKTVDDIKSKLLHPRTLTVNSERYLESIIKSSKALLEKFLISFQNIYKKYKCSTKIASTEDDPNLEEADGSVNDEHLKSLIMASLFDDLSCLNTRNILKCMKNIIENINKLDPDHYQDIKKPINNNLQLLERLILLFEYFITQQVSSYRVTSKLTSVVLNIFLELARKGFCIPPEFSDEISNDCQTQQSGGMGLGEGEGETDVSDRIESEDQLDDTKQEGQTERKNEDTDCKEEDNAIEMSEDFDSKLQDVSKQSDEENEEPDSDAEEQMGDTEKGADRLDEQIWSSDEEQDEESEIDKGNTNEEKGNKGEMEDEQKLGAKENQSADNRKPPDTQTEPENEQLIDKINEENPEYDDQVDPYHGNQPELPEPEPMDLPEDLDLDDDNEKANGEGEEENPFDIDTMKEQAPPDDKDEKKQEESGDNNKDEVDKPNESDDDVDIQENQQEDTELSKDKFEEERENTPAESKHDDDQEDTNKNQQTTLDQTHTDENQVQPMDTDKNVNESTDKVNANQAKNQISNENNPVNQEDTPDKEGVGQSQMEESSSGHRGAANAQQEAEDNKEECSEKQEKRQRPGESDSKRSLGDTLEPVKKKFKTIHTDDNEEIEESQPEKSNAEMYQHIKEAQDHTEQILDVATKEQVEQQKEIPNSDENELEKPTESSDNVPEAQENIDMTNEIKQKAEKLENEKSEAKSQHPEGDIVKDGDEIEMEVEGEIIQTSSVARGNQSSHHIQLSNFVTESIKLSNEDTTVIRKQIEEQLANWREIPSSEEAQRTWEKISSLTSPLAQNLSEQLRLVLEPTQASQLRGDFKTGKRINMRKIIPYIASQFRKDKIWLRRTKPAKREYQIVLAIDDSSSMDDNHSKELAFESVALISKALTLLESGQLSVLRFGESTELLHKLDESFTDKCGYKLLQKFQFDQRKTCVGQMINFATEMLNNAHSQSNAFNAKLLVIVSDGRGIFSEGETYIRQAIRRATLANIFMIFIIIDNPANNSSILDIRTPVFNATSTEILSIKSYMDSFPFPFYIILHDINSLPNVLSDALRQWFEMVSSNDRI